MTYIRGGWIGVHYVLQSDDEAEQWHSICGFMALRERWPSFQDLPTGEPCLDCVNGEDHSTHQPVERRVRLRAPNDPGTLWLLRNDARLLSPCHRVPVHVAPGPMQGVGTPNWSMMVDRVCATCGRVLTPDECIATKTADELRSAPKETE